MQTCGSPEVIPQLIEQWRKGYDVVFAVRPASREEVFKRATAALFYRLFRRMTTTEIRWMQVTSG
jgi:dolichol-phosphate mannosyltransferase